MFANLKIAVKLGAGFGIVLLLTFGVGLAGWNGLRDVEYRSKTLDNMLDIARYALSAHYYDAAFDSSHSIDELTQSREYVTKLLDQAQATRVRLHDSADLFAVDEVSKSAADYRTAFATYVETQVQRDAAIDRMRTAAIQAVEQIDRVNDSQVTQLSELRQGLVQAQSDRMVAMDVANNLTRTLLEVKAQRLLVTQNPGDTAHIQGWQAASRKFLDLLEKEGERLKIVGEADQAKLIGSNYQRYMTSFETYLKGKRPEDLDSAVKTATDTFQVLDKMRDNIEKALATKSKEDDASMTAKLANGRDTSLIVKNFLEVRVAAKEFIASGERKWADLVEKNITYVQEMMNSLLSGRLKREQNIQAVRTALAAVESYREAFRNFSALTERQVAENDRSDKASARVVELVDKLESGQRTKMDQDMNNAERFILVAGGAALVLGALVALLLARVISRAAISGLRFAEEVAEGNLRARLELLGHDELGQLLLALEGMRERLAKVVGQVRGTAGALGSAAAELSSTAQSLSQASSEQAASVEETSASLEQMSASIGQNSDNAAATEGAAMKSAQEAVESGKAVSETVEAMRRIAERIGFIEDIAYKTNLLALNAAIEAARAGEHGKGFAVVAAEVRKLAENSQVAAREISTLAKSSVAVAERAGGLLTTLVPGIEKTAELVQEISAASREQTGGVAQVNTAMGQVDQAVQQNAAAAEELAATAAEVTNQAEELNRLMAFFQLAEGVEKSLAVSHVHQENNRSHSAPSSKVTPGRKIAAKSMPTRSANSRKVDEFSDFKNF
ncbi:methyl-accepting chemotaxis protein [Gammaproteobacteria bacterium]